MSAERAPAPFQAPKLATITPISEVKGWQWHETPVTPEITLTDVLTFCPDVPVGAEKYARFDARDESVAAHEFNHVLLAYSLGVAIEDATIIRKPGVYEGVTHLRALPSDLHKLQIIAAGGAVHGVGYGSDMQKVREIHRGGGMTPEAAIASARSLIGRIDPEVRKMANQIFAYRKHMTGGEVVEILKRAEIEAKYNEQERVKKGFAPSDEREGMTPEEYNQLIEKVMYINDRVLDLPGVVMEIRDITEELENGRVRKYKVVNGQKDEASVEEHCSGCGMPEGHAANCAFKHTSRFTEGKTILPDEQPIEA